MQFSHLHCHTQYSLLDGAADIKKLFKKAKADDMPAIAITDHGNMFGVFEFVAEGHKQGIKPIVGCEFYLVEDRHKKQFTKEQKDVRRHQLLLAKNAEGYRNLAKLCSLGFIEGMYGKYPRIDKELLVKYHKGLIATTCCIGASVPQAIIKKGEEAGRQEFKWWLDLFGEDYYVEIQRHGIRDQIIANDALLKYAKEFNVKVICSNDSHYVEQDDANAHDILLCVNTGDKQSTPTNKDFDDENPMPKGTRFAFFNDEFYFKTKDEMLKTFSDLPESLDNTQEIVDKVELLKLNRDILLPNFPIPEEFRKHSISQMIEFNGKMKELTADVLNQWEYLKHWTFEGARKKYKEITPEVEERLNFELNTIKNMGFPGYFLIVADFIQAGRDMGVLIGPGRGSAAGSAVAYAIGITNIDPIKYDLLFERFLNPDRISMPDIDTDFDDEGRQRVIDYVVQKYGKNQVAQIITYGTMAAKSSIKDVARVMDLPLQEANAVVKLVPDKPTYNMNLDKVFKVPLEKMADVVTPDEVENLKKLREMLKGNDLTAKVLKEAQKLEGTVRNVGIHAAGIIIAPSDLTDLIPVSTSKESNLLITQYEGKIIEDAGVIKMDFLGLRNLTIIKEALRMIEANHGVKIDIDYIPLDDIKVFELFQRGETNAVFQFESDGMKKYMRELKPDRFEDLIAMNALYRPGPIAYIPNFINRKHGREKVEYDLPEMEEYLADTYGICVTGDTLIHDAKTGERVRIDSLANRVGEFWVQGVNDDLLPASAPITHWVCNGEKEVLEVRLRNGSRVKLTPDHQVLTETGWQQAGSLQVGSVIATPRKLFVENEQEYDRDKLRVLAYILADGSLSGCGATADFVSKDPQLLDAYTESISTFERLETRTLQQVRDVTRIMVAGTDKTHYHETNSLVAQLREWGLKTMKGGCRSDEKFVPEFVFGLTEETIAFFLASLWDCDGHIGKDLNHFKTISPRLANDVKTLLLRLGIYSVTYQSTYHNNRRNQEMTAYQVSVYNLKAFAELIGPHLVSKKIQETLLSGHEVHDNISRTLFLDELGQVWKGSGRGLMDKYGFDRQHLLPNKLRTCPRISLKAVLPLIEHLPLNQSARLAKIRWDEVVEIKAIGKEKVYDITVEGIHNFVGNNIILHNCTYQEQIMLLSQKMAGFTKGDADVLRKAMGKKQIEVLNKMKSKFIDGGKNKGLDEKKLDKVWTDWEAFASYAFNKSHSTCYAFVAYQTAYLKAHYPAEYMAAVLTSSLGNIEKITFFLEECKALGIPVLGPDVNESERRFGVNKRGEIRFGLGGIKGTGDAAVESIIEERTNNGPFKDLFDFMTRVNLRTVNKKTIESLAYAGAFDLFEEYHRAQYFTAADGEQQNLIEKLIKYANAVQADKSNAQASLFGGFGGSGADIAKPKAPIVEQWSDIERLRFEKDVVGFYISGHPLDMYRLELTNFCTCTLDKVMLTSEVTETSDTEEGDMPAVANVEIGGRPLLFGKDITVAGIVSSSQVRTTKTGNPFCIFKLEDYAGSMEMALFGEDFVKFSAYVQMGHFLFVKGKIQNRWKQEDQYEFKITSMQLLNEVREKLTKEIKLQLDLDMLDGVLVTKLNEAVQAYPGHCALTVSVVDHQSRTEVKLQSRTHRVAPTNEFFKLIESMGGVNFSVN
ncbi:DNA polymerase III subunit alpha [Runella limosa]|uniref:DNA polymerase III subunit alpha n=1 Tax=Runella limosa TaxID=370978 RepID=UPI0004032B63|nr:DNA polymerase III subunit alpha [Runella limosa]